MRISGEKLRLTRLARSAPVSGRCRMSKNARKPRSQASSSKTISVLSCAATWRSQAERFSVPANVSALRVSRKESREGHDLGLDGIGGSFSWRRAWGRSRYRFLKHFSQSRSVLKDVLRFRPQAETSGQSLLSAGAPANGLLGGHYDQLRRRRLSLAIFRHALPFSYRPLEENIDANSMRGLPLRLRSSWEGPGPIHHEDTTESRRITGLHRPRGAGQSQNRSSVRPYPPGRFRECKCATPQGIRVYPSIGAAEGREIRLPCYGAPRSFGRRIYAQSRQELRHQSALLPGVAEQAAEPKHSSCFWRRARGQPGRAREFEAGLLRESAPPKRHQPARESRYR